ncbi:hypothetical protein KRZ98_06195 [Sphingobium sp. AS12]|uniref:hypothetical protein n=1 Tax=Sphingobium sp. AS12 TaxID=2849495 RepID=UPI001C31C5A9|nr:hypothetical protein [Sphingobium sp. AS12]MBV2147880.1 hypothetical protein [Sphingobium sp. AS12]
MSLFPETIAMALAGGKVQCAFLVLFDFTSEPMRLWRGNGLLKTNDGARWQGIGNLGSMSGIEQAVNGEAPEMSFTLMCVDQEAEEGEEPITGASIMRLARDEFESEVKGRLVYVLIQFFGIDDPDDPDNQRPLDNPYPVGCGRCLTPTFTMTDEGERSVTISAESLFSLRSRPNWAMYTDADQQRRYPGAGDKGFEFVASMVNKVVTWPDF